VSSEVGFSIRSHPTLRTVLVVDDNAIVRRNICELFTRESDFQVCGEAEDGDQAIEKALLLKPALIVIDLSMPRRDGLSAIRILRTLMPEVPLILYTAYDVAMVRDEATKAGAADVISKGDIIVTLIMRARALTQEHAA
jgi:two-component system, NarL family, response regulator NreC